MHLLVLTKKDLNIILEEFDELHKEMEAIALERRAYHEELINKLVEENKKVHHRAESNAYL